MTDMNLTVQDEDQILELRLGGTSVRSIARRFRNLSVCPASAETSHQLDRSSAAFRPVGFRFLKTEEEMNAAVRRTQ